MLLRSSACSTQGAILSPRREDQHPPVQSVTPPQETPSSSGGPGHPLSEPLSCLTDGCPSMSLSLRWFSALPCGCQFSVAMVTKSPDFITSQSGGHKSPPKCQQSCHSAETLGKTHVQLATSSLPVCPPPITDPAATPRDVWPHCICLGDQGDLPI